MSRPLLTLADLAAGLANHADRYTELAVFADDVEDIRDIRENKLPEGVRAIDEQGKLFAYEYEGQRFLLELYEEGVVKLRRPAVEPGPGTGGGAIVGAIAGTAIGSAVSKKGDGWAAGLLLGLLAGAALGGNDSKRPRRVLTMRFDPDLRAWQAYDGGLVTWMKSEFQSAG